MLVDSLDSSPARVDRPDSAAGATRLLLSARVIRDVAEAGSGGGVGEAGEEIDGPSAGGGVRSGSSLLIEVALGGVDDHLQASTLSRHSRKPAGVRR